VSWLELLLAAVQAIAAGIGALNAWLTRKAGADAARASAREQQAAQETIAAGERAAAEQIHIGKADDGAFDQDFRRD